MKVGDLVKRNLHCTARKEAQEQQARLGNGIILSKQLGGRNPVHKCITVLYPKTGETWDIAESLMVVISET